MVKKFLSRFYLGLILLFLYAPIFILIILSFNKSKSRSKWGGFTLTWYHNLFQDEAIMTALTNTLIIALLSALIACVIGTCACLAINNMRKLPRTILLGISNVPMMNADIVTGISLMLLFIALNYPLSFSSVLMSHITFNIPYVILSVMPRLTRQNASIYEAALDLGATKSYAFFKIILPDIFPGILSGFLLAFTMSLDDFVITYFTKGAGFDTLSTIIYTEVRKGIKPEMYALSTLLFISILILLVLINRRKDKEHTEKSFKNA